MKIKINQKICETAYRYGWEKTRKGGGNIVFARGDVMLQIAPLTLTVLTILDHPKRGRTILRRRKVKESMLERLFNNPRSHTGLGDYIE